MNRGDRVISSEYPDLELQVIACFGDICGCTCEQWPKGATRPIPIGTITSVNDVRVQFEPIKQTKQTKRRRQSAA